MQHGTQLYWAKMGEVLHFIFNILMRDHNIDIVIMSNIKSKKLMQVPFTDNFLFLLSIFPKNNF